MVEVGILFLRQLCLHIAHSAPMVESACLCVRNVEGRMAKPVPRSRFEAKHHREIAFGGAGSVVSTPCKRTAVNAVWEKRPNNIIGVMVYCNPPPCLHNKFLGGEFLL